MDLFSSKKRFRLAITNLVYPYIKNISRATHHIVNLIQRNGILIVSIPHPCFNQDTNQDWFWNPNIHDLIITDYFNENVFSKKLGDLSTYHYHRILETYTEIFSSHNLNILRIIEPKPVNKEDSIFNKASKNPFYLIFVLRYSSI